MYQLMWLSRWNIVGVIYVGGAEAEAKTLTSVAEGFEKTLPPQGGD